MFPEFTLSSLQSALLASLVFFTSGGHAQRLHHNTVLEKNIPGPNACIEPGNAHLENLYVTMLARAEFHESLAQVDPIRRLVDQSIHERPADSIHDSRVRSRTSGRGRNSLCPYEDVILRNELRYPRDIKEAEMTGRKPDGNGCAALAVYTRVLYNTQEKDSKGLCKYVPGWYKQTLAFVATDDS